MIVAARATDRQRHRPARDDIHLVINFLFGADARSAAPDGQKAERRQIARIVPRQAISSNLLCQKLVVRQVFIEGANHPVAIGVSKGEQQDGGIADAHRVRIARHVQPMARASVRRKRVSRAIV